MKNKAQLRRRADRLWTEIILSRAERRCEVCGGVANQAHHFFPKGMNSRLRFDLDNGISICQRDHFRHHLGDPLIHQIIIKKRGDNWFKKLRAKARKPISPSYITYGYYEKQIEILMRANGKSDSL